MTPLEARERMYSDSEIVELIQKAKRMGLLSPQAEPDTNIDCMNIGELERLVTVVQ